MANWWTLKILSGPDAGKTFTLKKDRSVIGRVKGDVVLEGDTELSSVHAEITFDKAKGCPILVDLKSRNGTRVNGEKIEKRALMPGDRVRFGVTELVLEPPASEETIAVVNPDFTNMMQNEGATKVSAGNQAAASSSKPGAPANAVTAAVAAAVAATAAREKDDETAKTKAAGERVRPSRSDSFADSIGPSVFYGYFSRFFGVIVHPTRFFDFLASENAIMDGDQAYRRALQFGAINWIFGGLLTVALSYYCTYVWKTMAPGTGYASNPFAMVFETILGFFVLPVIAVVYHWICLLLGGKGPFKVAVRALCYVSAAHLLKDLVSFIPKAGPFLTIAFQAYTYYLLSLAATRLYYVGTLPAFGACAASTAIAVALTISSQHSTMTMQEQLVKLNPFLSKSIGASFVDSNAPAPAAVQQRDPAAKPAEAKPHEDTPGAAAAAPSPAPDAVPIITADPQPPTTAGSDPEPPSSPTMTSSDPTPPSSGDPAPPAAVPAPASSDGSDPEPPKFPGN